MNTWCVLQEDYSENDEVLYLSPLYFFHMEKISYSSKNALYFINYLSMLFPYIPSCEPHKQFGAEPAQYGVEINFKLTFNIFTSFTIACTGVDYDQTCYYSLDQ